MLANVSNALGTRRSLNGFLLGGKTKPIASARLGADTFLDADLLVLGDQFTFVLFGVAHEQVRALNVLSADFWERVAHTL